jgi:HEAT repeat protein
MRTEGAAAIPAVLEVAKDTKRGPMKTGESKGCSVRELALRVIGDMGPSAASAVPGLVEFLSHPDLITRRAAAEALLKIGPASVTNPIPIIAALQDEWGGVREPIAKLLRAHASATLKAELGRLMAPPAAPDVRRDACEWAGQFGPEGRVFLPALRIAENDKELMVRMAAEAAIARIESNRSAR